MPRRLSRILLIFLLVFYVPSAHAAQLPSKYTFSVAHEKLQTAIAGERLITWQATVSPTALEGLDGGALGAVSGMLSSMNLEGLLQTFRAGGGLMEAAVTMEGREIARIGQMSQDGRIGINLTGDWISIAEDMAFEAVTLLELDAFSASLLSMDYESLRSGDMPFVTPIYEQGLSLWALGSPYAQDNSRLSTPSGWTSHANTYEIDTDALRSMLGIWVKGLTMDGLSLGIDGSGMPLGVSEEAFEAFVAKAEQFAQTVELSKPITFSMTFGEGDVLRTAKGSGTLLEDGRRTGISYSYSYNESNTKATRKYSIDFQPRNADTLTLSCTWATSSNGKTSGGHNVTINASGTYDGKPYRIKCNIDLTNKFSLSEDEKLLTETITGTMDFSVKYDGVAVADVSIRRNSTGTSTDSVIPDVEITDSYDIVLKNAQGTQFAGLVTMESAVNGTATPDSPLETAMRLEETDFMAMERLRDDMRDTLAQTKQRLVQALPVSVLSALLQAY